MDVGVFNSWQKGKNLYLLLWVIAIFFIGGIILTGNAEINAGKNLFKNQDFETAGTTNETINELLLSADELSIAEKNSFVNLYLKPVESNGVITATATEGDNEKDDIYKQIFNRKINKLKVKKGGSSDFSIKPIPK